MEDIRYRQVPRVGKEVHDDDSQRAKLNDPFHGLKISDPCCMNKIDRHEHIKKFVDSDGDGMPDILSSDLYHNKLNQFHVHSNKIFGNFKRR